MAPPQDTAATALVGWSDSNKIAKPLASDVPILCATTGFGGTTMEVIRRNKTFVPAITATTPNDIPVLALLSGFDSNEHPESLVGEILCLADAQFPSQAAAGFGQTRAETLRRHITFAATVALTAPDNTVAAVSLGWLNCNELPKSLTAYVNSFPHDNSAS